MAVLTRMAATSPNRNNAAAAKNLVLVIIALCFAAPLAWLALASINDKATLSADIPSQLSFSNFSEIFNAEILFTPLLNSLLISGGTALITVAASILAAYPLSRYATRFNRNFLYITLFSTGLPITAMMVPVYSLFVQFNLLDSVLATTVFMAATSLPMAIWMTKNFMDDVPMSLEEAAWVDGAAMLRTLWSIVMPLMKPGIGVVFVFVFIQAWGNFFVPYLLLLSPEQQPAAVSIYNFFGAYGGVAYGQLAAFSLIYSTPVITLYVLVTKVFGGKFAMAGGVKG